MKTGLNVPPESVINPRQFQPDSGQPRPLRQDRLEPPGRFSQKAEARLDKAEQEQTLDTLVFIFGLRPFQEPSRIPQPTGLE